MMPCSSLPIPGNPFQAHPTHVHFCLFLWAGQEEGVPEAEEAEEEGQGGRPAADGEGGGAGGAHRCHGAAARRGEPGLRWGRWVGCRMVREACCQAGLCGLPGRQHSCHVRLAAQALATVSKPSHSPPSPLHPPLPQTAYQPLKVQLKRKHWAGEGSEAATASKRCTEIFERQVGNSCVCRCV